MTQPAPVLPAWLRRFDTLPWKIAGTIAAGALCFGGIVLLDDDKPFRDPNGTDAAEACKGFVSQRLKAPSTAEFSNLRYGGEAPNFVVTGSVDAENLFGATLRMNWTCRVRAESGSYSLESLTGLN